MYISNANGLLIHIKWIGMDLVFMDGVNWFGPPYRPFKVSILLLPSAVECLQVSLRCYLSPDLFIKFLNIDWGRKFVGRATDELNGCDVVN